MTLKDANEEAHHTSGVVVWIVLILAAIPIGYLLWLWAVTGN